MNDTDNLNIIRFNKIESTQIFAKTLIKEQKNVDGTIIITEEQTFGRGRLHRKWISPKGGVWLSIIIQKKIPLSLIEGFSVRFGIKLIRELRKLTNASFQIKWPNDIILNNRKLGGILIDISSQDDLLKHLILGVGINVNILDFPDEIKEIASSMRNELNKEFSLNDIEQAIINSYQELITELVTDKLEVISEIWKKYSFTYKTKIKIQIDDQQIVGKEIGITETGNLLLNKNGVKEIISVGEINLLRKI